MQHLLQEEVLQRVRVQEVARQGQRQAARVLVHVLQQGLAGEQQSPPRPLQPAPMAPPAQQWRACSRSGRPYAEQRMGPPGSTPEHQDMKLASQHHKRDHLLKLPDVSLVMVRFQACLQDLHAKCSIMMASSLCTYFEQEDQGLRAR